MTTSAYFDGLNQKLLAAIPSGARSVLEFGCANGRLGAAYRQANPGARWTGIDANEAALAAARSRLDDTIAMDLDAPQADRLSGDHDVIVMGDVLELLRDPRQCLRVAHEVAASDARLVSCVPNMAHVSVIERLLAGDISYDSEGLLDATHVRFLSPASVLKLFLDSGWLPNIHDRYTAGHANKDFVEQLLAAAARLGIPAATARLNILSYQLIVDAIKWESPAAGASTFSVVVPVTIRAQFNSMCAARPVWPKRARKSFPSRRTDRRARARIRAQARGEPLIVFCHQDVYFPRGSGYALGTCLTRSRANRPPTR